MMDASVAQHQIHEQVIDVPAGSGGETTFMRERSGREEAALSCQPCAGSVLIFTQNLLHEGSLLKKGLKYTLRTEAMYRM